DGGVADPDHHVARGEVIEGQLLEARGDLAALGMDAERLERLHDFTALSRVRASQAMRPWVLRVRSPASACSIAASGSVLPCARASFSHRASIAARMAAAGSGAVACARARAASERICSLSDTASRGTSVTRLKCIRYIDSGP